MAAILNRYNVTVVMFFDNEEEAREFAKDMVCTCKSLSHNN